MDDDQRLLDLFHALDRLPGPEHLHYPDEFDYHRGKVRAIRLRQRLNSEFGGTCRLDDQVLDASYSFALRFPPRITEAGEWIVVRLSNYGDLAVVMTPRPDSHPSLDAAVADGKLSETDRRRIETALADMGYEQVPLRLLQLPYDGVTWLASGEPGPLVSSYGPYEGEPTWWTRFFEYL
ncbi:hypothetical protein ACWC10_20445 [Streptomyces sp. NPDC001595]|uniref:hypothetical protein n=1 Tax=Streptomyces sp. NPDC001532 TaxID=3154520 RepID=UPI003327310E